jgi:hypothetical protein
MLTPQEKLCILKYCGVASRKTWQPHSKKLELARGKAMPRLKFQTELKVNKSLTCTLTSKAHLLTPKVKKSNFR